jgi:hypothetical protein
VTLPARLQRYDALLDFLVEQLLVEVAVSEASERLRPQGLPSLGRVVDPSEVNDEDRQKQYT